MVFTGELKFEEPCVRTSRIVQAIANSLEPDIQLTCDTPNNHLSGRMPVLDLEVWVKDNKVMHSLYSKPVSSKYTILKRTALSDTVKKHTIFQECIRRLYTETIFKEEYSSQLERMLLISVVMIVKVYKHNII